MARRMGPEHIERRVAVLTRLAESGLTVREVADEMHISSRSIYAWRRELREERGPDLGAVGDALRRAVADEKHSAIRARLFLGYARVAMAQAKIAAKQLREDYRPARVTSAPTVRDVADRAIVSMSPVNTGQDMDVAEDDGEIEAIVAGASDPGREVGSGPADPMPSDSIEGHEDASAALVRALKAHVHHPENGDVAKLDPLDLYFDDD